MTIYKFCVTEYLRDFYHFYIALLSRANSRISRRAKRWLKLMRAQNSSREFLLMCNILTIVTGLIWIYLWYQMSPKTKQAYITTIGISLLKYGFILLAQVKTVLTNPTTRSGKIRLVSSAKSTSSESLLARILRQESTCMLLFAYSILDSAPSCYKLALLTTHSFVGILETVETRIVNFADIAKFFLGMLENIVLVVFWCESFETLHFNNSICFTLAYSLKLEESDTATRSLQLAKAIYYFVHGKFPKEDTIPAEKAVVLQTQRPVSFGFDCFSIISDLR